MEHKLKKQRDRLFRRVAVILFAVWLTVSATYCGIRLYNEKINVQNKERESLSDEIHRLSVSGGNYDFNNSAFLFYSGLVSTGDRDEAWNSQVIILDRETGEKVSDTAKKVGVKYEFFTINSDYAYSDYGFIDYDKICSAMSDSEFNTISDYLNSQPKAGRYELVCTKAHIIGVEFIPLELKIALVEDDSLWFVSDRILETFSLDKNLIDGEYVFKCGEMRRNIVPKRFLLDGEYNIDYISALTDEQRDSAFTAISTGPTEFLFYFTDYLNINEYYGSDKLEAYIIRYARKVNLLESCKAELAAGVGILFVFFLIIAVILCLMIWRTVKTQIIQEQKRTDLTNALAHNIKTPLFIISGYAYSLKENIDEDERDSYLEKIIEQTDSVNEKVHKMLELSRLDSCSMTLRRSEFDLGGLCGGIISEYKNLPDGKTISFEKSGENIINADRELIKTAVQNLIDNAAQYSLPNSEIKVELSGKTLKIMNECEGLSKADLKQLWEPYARKDKSRRQTGNGLGLSIVKSILDLHGAEFDFKLKGSTLVFSADF